MATFALTVHGARGALRKDLDLFWGITRRAALGAAPVGSAGSGAEHSWPRERLQRIPGALQTQTAATASRGGGRNGGCQPKNRGGFPNAEGCVLAIDPQDMGRAGVHPCSSLGLSSCLAGGDRCRCKSEAGGSPCNPEQSEGEQALPLPGNELERDPADKEIFKVQLMSEMSHWLNETKVRLENKSPRCKERGWWGCRRQRMGRS